MNFDHLTQDRGVQIGLELARVSRSNFHHCSQLLESLGIGVGQVPILAMLMHSAPMTQRQLAGKIHVTPATISGTLKRMEREGLVVRELDTSDARSTRVRLSLRGQELCARALDYFCQGSSIMLQGFSDAEVDALHGYLRRMCDNLESAACMQTDDSDERSE